MNLSEYEYIFKKINLIVPNLDIDNLDKFILPNTVDILNEKSLNKHISENIDDLGFNILLKNIWL